MKKINRKFSILGFIFVVLLYLLVYNKWIFNLQILTHGDWVYFFKETMTTLRIYYFSLWLGDFSFGGVLLDVGQAPINASYGFLARYLNLSFPMIERIMHFWPIVFVTPLSSAILLNKLVKSKIAVVIGVFVYTFNTYFLILQTGTITLMMSYALAPLIIYFFDLVLVKRKAVYAIITSLFLFISSAYEPRGFYIIVWILLFYTLYYLLFIRREHASLLKNLLYAIVPIVLVIALNIYWILGLLKIGVLKNNILFARGLFGDEFLNINYAITLFHPFWSGYKPSVFIVQSIPIYFWLVPIAAFLGLFLKRDNKKIFFFGFISLLGILLTKQASFPFSGFYLWLYGNLPGFNAFREASKFYFLIALGYSVLIAGLVDYVSQWNNSTIKIYSKYLIFFVLTAVFLWNTKPLVNGEAGMYFVPRYIPNDYIILSNFVLSKDNYFRTLSAPRYSRWNLYTNIHPEISLVDIVNSDWKSYINNKYLNTQKYSYAEAMLSLFNVQRANNLLDISSIKYVYVPLEDKVNDDDFFVYYGKSRQYYIDELNKISWLHKINIGTKEIVVYENESYRPHVYTTLEKETIYKDLSYKIYDVKYSFVRPTEYKFSVKNVSNPFYLNFSESYNPGWNIRVGSFNWLDVLINKNYFISDKNNSQNDATLNSYYIDPSVVCKVESCKVNKDGRYDISGTLYFAPQSYMYLGLIISGSTLIIIFGYLGFIGFNSLKRKYERKNK